VLRSFQFFQHGGDIVIIAAFWKPEWARLYLKPQCWLRPTRLNQAETQKVIDHCLKRLTSASHLLFQEYRNVIVDGKCCSHIMMLK
jgi:hypothetical protein